MQNEQSLRGLGGMRAQIQESQSHFKVVDALNRRDYFRERLNAANQRKFQASTRSGIASACMPLYGLAHNLLSGIAAMDLDRRFLKQGRSAFISPLLT